MTSVREIESTELNGAMARRWLVERNGRDFSVLLSRDEIAPGDERWHLSIAGADREVPAWDDVAALVHRLRPGVTFVLGVPPKSWWINVHPGCLHCWELRDPTLEGQWRSERSGHTPS